MRTWLSRLWGGIKDLWGWWVSLMDSPVSNSPWDPTAACRVHAAIRARNHGAARRPAEAEALSCHVSFARICTQCHQVWDGRSGGPRCPWCGSGAFVSLAPLADHIKSVGRQAGMVRVA